MRRFIPILLLAPAVYAGNACVSSKTGNWHDTTVWSSCGGGFPGDGDTVTLANGFTVTCEPGQQCIAGTSASDMTTRAITDSNDDTGSGNLIVNGTLTARGMIWQSRAATWTGGPGGVIEFDNSFASTPASATYAWFTGGTNGPTTHATINLNGNQGAHFTLRSAAGNTYLSCGIREGASGISGPAAFTGTYVDVKGVSCGTYPAGTWFVAKIENAGGKFNCSHCTSDAASGGILFKSFAASADSIVQYSDWEGVSNATYSSCAVGYGLCVYSGAPSANHIWNHNVIRGPLDNIACADLGLAFSDSVLGGNGTTAQRGSCSYPHPLTNVLVDEKNGGGTGLQLQWNNGNNDGVYLLDTVLMANAHDTSWRYLSAPSSLTHFIRDKATTYAVDSGQSEALQVESNPPTPQTLTVRNSMDLPAADGGAGGNFFNNAMTANATATNLTLQADHNTFQLQGTAGVSGIGGETSGTGGSHANMMTVQDTIAYRGVAGPACLTSWLGTLADNTFIADYNWIWRINGNPYIQAGCPTAAKYAGGSPGTHDGAGDPAFADMTRRLALFDQKYLVYPATNPDWAAGRAYAAGDLVSHAVNGIHGGVKVNYRAIAAHTSAAVTEPGQTDAGVCGATCAWSAKWEYAGLQYIKNSVLAGETFTDGSIGLSNESMIAALIKWTFRGYTPQNRALCQADHTGTAAPGAVACDAAAAVAPAVF